MATEPPVHSLVDASASVTPESTTINDQNVDSSLLTTDNASKADVFDIKRTSFIDDQPNSADVSISGGSDSEAVRLGGTGQKDGSHNRSASTTKKLATFKAVNPNKSFLGAKAGSPVPALKPADRPSGPNTPPTGSATLSSRPRLVAKTGNQKDGVSRLGSLNGAKTVAPSAQAVWNKNRPPEPKKFTDEELKNHGIHMASRLNETDVSGQNKWADIDDDDDDWAPEAITWGDGTKTNIPHPDEISPEPTNDPRLQPQGKPASPSPQTASKLGVSGPGTKGLILKNSHSSVPHEKPALVTKPSASQASKSPWAALPPVEKVSPAVPPPPEQRHPFRAVPKDKDGPGPFARGPSTPPREDGLLEDFGRQSWRDPSAPRELYNTQSGRYETVPDHRGSYHSMKPPAVLQRPHGSHGDYPAEPSPVFSATRTSHDPPYSRRRGSSVASANSGSFYQKRGNDLPLAGSDMLAARRPSFAGSTESPISPASKHVQPYGQPSSQGASWPPQESSHLLHTASHQGPPHVNMGPPPVPSQPQVDQVEYQKKLMKERQELARKRRNEEEAREEAAKRERIQKKLDALGPPPEKKSEKETPTESGRPIHIQQRSDQVSEAGKPSPQEAPKTIGAPQDPLLQKSMLSESSEAQARPATTPRRPSQSQGQDKRPNIWSGQGPRNDPPGWSRGGPSPARNVWGSPDIDRALGNGTFNPDLGRVPGTVQPPLGSTGPSPIGPPGSRTTSQPRSQQKPAPIGSRAPPRSGTDLATQWVSAVVESDRALVAVNRQRRNDREAQLADQGLTVADAQPTIQEAWRPVQLASDGTRRVASSTDASHPPVNLWNGPPDEFGRDTQTHGDMASSTNPGVIGSGSTAMMSQKSQQGRSSRFFPTQHRPELATADFGRSTSPTPPPPTMMGHPAYEGDTSRPHVSLPKPQPVVKLPPVLKLASERELEQPGHRFTWAQHQPYQSDAGSKSNWQTKFHNLFKDAKSPTKMANVDASSKKSLDLHPQHELATVSLPNSITIGDASGDLRTKPMAEECFEEQEMGSLPQIRIAHYHNDVPWQPVSGLMAKLFPRRLLIQSSTVEAFPFIEEITKGTPDMRIHLPGMTIPKTIAIPASLAITESVSPRGRGGRGGPRSRGQGRGKRDRDTSDSQSVHSPPNASNSSVPTASRGGRAGGGFRSRGGSWRGRGATDLHGPSPASSLPA